MKTFQKKQTKEQPKRTRSRLCILAGILVGLMLLRIFLVDVYYVPTSSMENTLKRHSYVLLSKYHYGPILPRTTHEIPIVKIFLKQLKPLPLFNNIRLPGLNKIQTSDIIIADNGDYKIAKRIVGLPHDTIQLKAGILYINEKRENALATYKYKFSIALTQKEARAYKNTVDNIIYLGDNHFELTGSKAVFEELESQHKVPILSDHDSVMARPIYPISQHKKWNKNNYGPLIIPSKGMKINLDDYNFDLYREVIAEHEKVRIKKIKDRYFIDDRHCETYEFTQDYFFVLGDNRMESIDSRYIGFIPMNKILGKIVYWK